MASPYGLVYGLSEIGAAGIPEAYSRGQMDKEKQRQAAIETESEQLSLNSKKGIDKALSDPLTEDESRVLSDPMAQMDPEYQKSLLDKIRAKRLASMGLGREAAAFMDRGQEAAIKAKANALSGVAQSLESGDYQKAKQLFSFAGSPVDKIEPDATGPGELGGWKVWYQGKPEPVHLDRISTLSMSKPGGAESLIRAQVVEAGKAQRQQRSLESKMAQIERQGAIRESIARLQVSGRITAAMAPLSIHEGDIRRRAMAIQNAHREDDNWTPEMSMDQATAEYAKAKDPDAQRRLYANDVIRQNRKWDSLTQKWIVTPGMEGAVAEAQEALKQGLRGKAKTANPRGGSLPQLPQVGEVRSGYRFKGGDPSSPKSWERVR